MKASLRPFGLIILGLILLGFAAALPAPVPVAAFGAAAPTPPPRLTFLPLVVGQQSPAPPTYPPAGSPPVAYVNFYRATANLPPVLENTEWSTGNWFHARYSVKNNALVHVEDPANAWYTDAGNAAAAVSNQVGSHRVADTDEWAIATWMQAAFHAVGILDPALLTIGFGSYRETTSAGMQMAAGLDILRGRGAIPAGVQLPVLWPGEGMAVPVGRQIGETPDPLTSCPGYSSPAGLPIVVIYGGGATPAISAHSFSEGAIALDHCVMDGNSYVNPQPALQELGQGILRARGAVIIIPRLPLVDGRTYTVSLTANGTPLTWSFHTAFVPTVSSTGMAESASPALLSAPPPTAPQVP